MAIREGFFPLQVVRRSLCTLRSDNDLRDLMRSEDDASIGSLDVPTQHQSAGRRRRDSAASTAVMAATGDSATRDLDGKMDAG